ncbi:hypothetical protein BH18ACT6_BH18ACT6_20240 [soil metagenome]
MQHYLLHNLDDVEASFLHEDVGRALEDLHGPASDTVALQLARHFDLAGLSAKAQHYLGLAGDRAMEVYANQEALAHYSRALDWATEDVDRFRLLVSRLKVHELSGNQEARRQDLEELEESAARLADPAKLAEVGLQRCKYETAVGNYAAARKAGDDAAALFKGVGDVAGEASARLALGLALYQSANYAEAREECQQALAVYRRANFPSHEAKLLSNLGVAYWRAHDLDGALEHFQESLAKARHVGARTVEGIALSNLAMVWQSKGDLDEARRYIEQGSTVNREIGSPNAIARTLGFLASILLGQGDYPGSRAADEEALEIDRRTGDRQDESFRLAYLGRLARRLGEHEKSSSLYGDALALCREIDDRDVEALCLRGLTALHLDLGEPAKAVELANQALDLSKQLGDHEGQALVALLAGHARIALDEIDGAERAYLYAVTLTSPPSRQAPPQVSPMSRFAVVITKRLQH